MKNPILFSFLLAAAIILMLFPMVSAMSLTFQDPGEFVNYISCRDVGGGGTMCANAYSKSNNGGNSYLYTQMSSSCSAGVDSRVINTDPLQTTYAAATLISTGVSWGGGYSTGKIILYDGSMNSLYSYTAIPGGSTPARVELYMVGGNAKIYYGGRLLATSPVLSQNPSYVEWGSQHRCQDCTCDGTALWDDLVYGTTENRNIFGAPEQGFFIKKDLINPAASGFCFSNGTIISNYNMTTTWGVDGSNTSRTIQLKEWSSGNVAGTKSTTSGTMGGSISWPIADDIINNPNAAYGFYITTIAGSGEVSEVIPYISSGASVAWDSASYGVGQPATITYSISSGGYWDLSTHTYSMVIADAYGNIVSTQPVTAQTGSKQYTFTSSDNSGVYYAELMATPIAGGNAIMMNYATTELTSYIVFSGYVMNAETTGVIIPAYVNITQGANTANVTTSSVGWNSSQSWLSGSPITIRTVATGYVSDVRSFTPISAASIALNISMLSTTPASVGVSIGGIVRDTQYGSPIPSATVSVVNGSSYNVATTNLAGYYRVDDLIPGKFYSVWSSKTGYANSSVAQKLATGV